MKSYERQLKSVSVMMDLDIGRRKQRALNTFALLQNCGVDSRIVRAVLMVSTKDFVMKADDAVTQGS